MNNFQIQKILFFCLTFSNTLIPQGVTYSSNLDKNLINNNFKKFSQNSNLLDSKTYNLNPPLTSSEKIEKSNSENTQKKNIDENIKTAVNELLIESKVQSEKNNILYADGDVIIKFWKQSK